VVKTDDEKFEAEKRRDRMAELELRIAQTTSGQRFLNRIHEIGKVRPLRDDPLEGES